MATRGPGSLPRYYIDSCVFIEVIKGRTNTGLDNPDHYANCLQLIDRLERREIEVYASTLVYVEVFNRGEIRLVDNSKSQIASDQGRQDAGALIDHWFRQSGIRWVEVHLDLVESARALARRLGCQSYDAVHLQSAIETRCTHFYTIDQKLIKPVEAAGGVSGLDVLLPTGEGQQVIL